MRPLKADIQEVYKRYARALVDEGRQTAVDASVEQAIDKFGMAPRVIVQKAGAPRVPTPVAGSVAGLEKTIRPSLPALDPILLSAQLLRFSARVCRVEVEETPIGTGFLVGPDVVLTNYHVLENVLRGAVAPNRVKLRFDHLVMQSGGESNGIVVSLSETWKIDATPYTAAEGADRPDDQQPSLDELDFALIQLNRPFGHEALRPEVAGSPPRGWIPLPPALPPVFPGMPVLILQHPNQGPLKLALDTDGVIGLNANATRLRYATNTDAGSSGSPCFDINWKLIALHHLGDPRSGRTPQYNQGVPVDKIRDRLRRMGKEGMLGGDSP